MSMAGFDSHKSVNSLRLGPRPRHSAQACIVKPKHITDLASSLTWCHMKAHLSFIDMHFLLKVKESSILMLKSDNVIIQVKSMIESLTKNVGSLPQSMLGIWQPWNEDLHICSGPDRMRKKKKQANKKSKNKPTNTPLPRDLAKDPQ